MTQAKPCFRTIEEYLDYDDSTDTRYELVNGELVEMGAENDINVEIASFLFAVLLQFVPHYLLRRGTEIAVSSRIVSSCVPDLMVITDATRDAMSRDRRSIVLPDMPAPALMIEVVSPGKPGEDNYIRDYVDKPKEYAARGIPEYWIIDPASDRAVVMVLTLKDGAYQSREFREGDRVISPTFPDLQLTADQILNAGR